MPDETPYLRVSYYPLVTNQINDSFEIREYYKYIEDSLCLAEISQS